MDLRAAQLINWARRTSEQLKRITGCNPAAYCSNQLSPFVLETVPLAKMHLGVKMHPVEVGEVWLQRDCAIIAHHRFVEPPQRREQRASIAKRLRVVRLQSDCPVV